MSIQQELFDAMKEQAVKLSEKRKGTASWCETGDYILHCSHQNGRFTWALNQRVIDSKRAFAALEPFGERDLKRLREDVW